MKHRLMITSLFTVLAITLMAVAPALALRVQQPILRDIPFTAQLPNGGTVVGMVSIDALTYVVPLFDETRLSAAGLVYGEILPVGDGAVFNFKQTFNTKLWMDVDESGTGIKLAVDLGIIPLSMDVAGKGVVVFLDIPLLARAVETDPVAGPALVDLTWMLKKNAHPMVVVKQIEYVNWLLLPK